MTDQPLLTVGGEQVVESFLGLVELGGLNVEDGREFAVAIEAFLVGAGNAGKADNDQTGQTDFHRQADGTAEQLTPLVGEAKGPYLAGGCLIAENNPIPEA
ncbi:hypothetical protein [Cyanobium sp. Morenito 9A2]|uniref:hypothetical protein n=1 Tax=Cyanobium sp. Morenito 9A2 TaxID=2823718 RepID=UPI0020CBD109|nr:hypothetical protein [Cyanobium sp. Morenito 9A2]MCP9849292.1 hypothetical protein [Cyanobium sp. Morenito 9A2]